MSACFCTGACQHGGGCVAVGPRIGEYARHSPYEPWRWTSAGPLVEPPPSRTVPDDPFKPTDDPQTPPPWRQIHADGIVIAQGWECPRCKLINAPHVNACSCQSVAQFTSEMP